MPPSAKCTAWQRSNGRLTHHRPGLPRVKGCPNTGKPGRVTKTQRRGLSNIDARAMQKFNNKIFSKISQIFFKFGSLFKLIKTLKFYPGKQPGKLQSRLVGRSPVIAPFLSRSRGACSFLSSFRGSFYKCKIPK